MLQCPLAFKSCTLKHLVSPVLAPPCLQFSYIFARMQAISCALAAAHCLTLLGCGACSRLHRREDAAGLCGRGSANRPVSAGGWGSPGRGGWSQLAAT